MAVLDNLEKINKALTKFNKFMLQVVGAIYLLGAILWLIVKALGK